MEDEALKRVEIIETGLKKVLELDVILHNVIINVQVCNHVSLITASLGKLLVVPRSTQTV